MTERFDVDVGYRDPGEPYDDGGYDGPSLYEVIDEPCRASREAVEEMGGECPICGGAPEGHVSEGDDEWTR